MTISLVHQSLLVQTINMFKFLAICLFALIAVVAAKPGIIAPIAYASPFGYPYTAGYTAPIVASPYVSPYTYAATYASPYYTGYPYTSPLFFRR
uniref:Uncharacterized protein n=1 Tax=Megaselia scalaris TaxID=36166 RepID=T1GPY2_MEGSC